MSLKSGSLIHPQNAPDIYTYLVKRVLLLSTYYYSTPRQEVSFVLEQLFGSVNFEKKKKKRISLPGGGSSSYKRPPAKSLKHWQR